MKGSTYNSAYSKGGDWCTKDRFVINQTLVFQIKFCGKRLGLRVVTKSYQAILDKNNITN